MSRINVFVLTIFLFSVGLSMKAQNSNTSWSAKMESPRSFIENKGQFPVADKSKISKEVLYGYDGKSVMIYFTSNGLVYSLNQPAKKDLKEEKERLKKRNLKVKSWEEKEQEEKNISTQHDVLNITWEGANPNVSIVAEDETSDYYSYCFRASNDSIKNVNYIKGFRKITYKNLYPNIDVVYEFYPIDGIKYSLILHPGADISQVKMSYSGDVKLKSNGDLHIPTLFGDIVDHTPVTYYSDNRSSVINSRFVTSGKSVSFHLDTYDATKTLIIDPWVQTPSMANSNCVWECEHDAAGNVYIIGGDMPLKLLKYNATGTLLWTYSTPWDTANDWLGTLATDLAGNSYVTDGSTAALQKINAAGSMVYSVSGGGLDEYWKIAFNCDQTKLIIGGTRLSLLPPANSYGIIFDINASTGGVNTTQTVGWERPNGLLNDIDEVRSISSSRNARYYYMTLDSLGTIDQNIGICPNNVSLLKLPHTYNFGYKCENFRPNNGNAGLNCVRANRYFVYTQNGAKIEKRSLATGAVITSATIPGGSNITVSLFTPVESQMGNDGIDIDTCGNVYVGSCGALIEYDANLNQLNSVSVPFNIYDVSVSTGGNVIVCGGTNDNSSTSRTGYVQSIGSLAACNPMSLYCCDANVCPAGPMCQTDPAITLTPATAGGIWSGLGITDVSAGTFDPSVAGPGSHTIVYTLACGSDSITINVNNCATLTACLATNGNVTVSGGTNPYTWQEYVPASTTPITNQAECTACGYTWQSLLGECMNGLMPVTNCNTPASWLTFGTGATITPPPGHDTLTVIDVYSNSMVIYGISTLPPCPTCPSLHVTNSSTNVACNGQATGSITANSGGVGPMTYLVTNSTGATVATHTNVTGSQNFPNLPAGTYNITVTDTAMCDTVITVVITQPAGINQSCTVVNEVCENSCTGSIGLTVAGGSGPFTYHWSNGATTQNISNLCHGNYTVTITDVNNCTYDTSVTVNYLIAASIVANPLTGAPPLPVAFTYTGSPGISYSWNFGDGSPADTSENPSHTFNTAGNYNVVLTVYSSPTSFCTVTVTIDVETPSHLVIPNVFTPNSDGFNDQFIMDYSSLASFSCSIFNRWGKEVYSWSDPSKGWDGTIKSGGKASDGVYYYIIEAKGTDNIEYNEHGTVTLVRH